MKSILFIIAFSVIGQINCQVKFKYSPSGMDPNYIVVNVDSLSQSELYKKSNNWIKNYYQNPDEVIDTKSENDFVRFTGIKQSAFKIGKLYIDVKYTIKVSFRDGKYKFEPIMAEYQPVSEYRTGWLAFDLENGSDYFKNGKPIEKFKAYTTEITKIFDELNVSMHSSINSKDDDW